MSGVFSITARIFSKSSASNMASGICLPLKSSSYVEMIPDLSHLRISVEVGSV